MEYLLKLIIVIFITSVCFGCAYGNLINKTIGWTMKRNRDKMIVDVRCPDDNDVISGLETETANFEDCSYGNGTCIGNTIALKSSTLNCHWERECSIKFPTDRVIACSSHNCSCLWQTPYNIRVTRAKCVSKAFVTSLMDSPMQAPTGQHGRSDSTAESGVKRRKKRSTKKDRKKSRGKKTATKCSQFCNFACEEQNKKELKKCKRYLKKCQKPGLNKKQLKRCKKKLFKCKRDSKCSTTNSVQETTTGPGVETSTERKSHDGALSCSLGLDRGLIVSHGIFPWFYKETESEKEFSLCYKWKQGGGRYVAIETRIRDICDVDKVIIKDHNDVMITLEGDHDQGAMDEAGNLVKIWVMDIRQGYVNFTMKQGKDSRGCEGFIICYKVQGDSGVPASVCDQLQHQQATVTVTPNNESSC